MSYWGELALQPRDRHQWGIREGKSEKIFFGPPPPLSFLLPNVHPLGRTFFLSPAFHCLKIQDDVSTFYDVSARTKKSRLPCRLDLLGTQLHVQVHVQMYRFDNLSESLAWSFYCGPATIFKENPTILQIYMYEDVLKIPDCRCFKTSHIVKKSHCQYFSFENGRKWAIFPCAFLFIVNGLTAFLFLHWVNSAWFVLKLCYLNKIVIALYNSSARCKKWFPIIGLWT